MTGMDPLKTCLRAAVMALPLLCFAAFADAAPAGTCINKSCHAALMDYKYVHGPVAVEDCRYCHRPAAGKHKFALTASGAALCAQCHDVKRAAMKSDCVSCHDPHGSGREFQLKPGAGGRCAL